MLEIDGSYGEGGGQILRTSLSLAMCTGTPFRITRIRAGRNKPGLLRQHLTAAAAAAEVSSATVHGLSIGSQELTFIPGKVKAGQYQFTVGGAGSATLVLQTVLPALWQADAPSEIRLQGGTHNPWAPPYHFLERAFAPLLQRMGIGLVLKLDRHGFHPAGGGDFRAEITPASALVPLHLCVRGPRVDAYAESLIAGVPATVAKRELAGVEKALNWTEPQLRIRQIHHDEGPGNILMATLQHEHVTEVFSAFGEKAVASERVANKLTDEVRAYLVSDGAVGPHLADQLLLPMALAGAGSITVTRLTEHARSNMQVIEKFLPVEFEFSEREGHTLIAVVR